MLSGTFHGVSPRAAGVHSSVESWITPWDSPFPRIFHSGMERELRQPIGLTFSLNKIYSSFDADVPFPAFMPPALTVDRTGAVSLTPPGDSHCADSITSAACHSAGHAIYTITPK